MKLFAIGLLFFCCCLLKSLSVKYYGIDIALPTSNTTWPQYIASNDISFAIVKVYNNDGSIVRNSASSIKSAWENGIRNISVYMFPCIQNSSFSISNLIQCQSPANQLNDITTYLNRNGIFFEQYSQSTWSPTLSPTQVPSANPTLHPTVGSPVHSPTSAPTSQPSSQPSMSPSGQPTSTPSMLTSASPTHSPTHIPTVYPTSTPSYSSSSYALIQTIFLDIEDDNPARYFDHSPAANVEFIRQFTNAAFELGIRVGIYTASRDWGQTTQLTNSTNPFSLLPLWTPRFDSTYSMDFFGGFGGWNSVFIKQTMGGSVILRRSGSSRICMNYMEITNTSTNHDIIYGPF